MKRCEPFPIQDYEVKCAARMWRLPTFASARRSLMKQRQLCEFWKDEEYEVMVTKRHYGAAFRQAVIRRKDGEKIPDHWKTLQRIKNEVIGKNWWAYECYPPQDEVIDTYNAYHLWAAPMPIFKTYTKEEAHALAETTEATQGQEAPSKHQGAS